MKYQAPKGMEDYYPEREAVKNKIFQVFREVAIRYGYQEVSTPAMESFKLLSAKSGEEIKQQIFMIEKRGAESLGLRFDLTVPITRLFITKQKELVKPVKWFSIGKMWRYEAPQKGRLREFNQLSVELFGSDKPEADAELLNMIIDIMKALGLSDRDFFIKMNNRKLLEGLLLTAIKKDQLEAVTRVIDKKNKLTDAEFEQELLDLGLDNFKIQRIRHAIQFNGKPSKVLKDIKEHFADVPEETKRGIIEMENICKLVSEKYVVLDLSVARGLAYYTGTVFEVFDRQEKFRSMAGGGRYDNMVKLFGGEDCPATGFAIGEAVTTLVLKDCNKLPEPELEPDYFIAVVSEDVRKDAMKLAEKLRKKYKVDIDLMGRKLKKQFEYANSIKAKKVIVVGPDEVKAKTFTVKDMKTGKEEKKKL
ncbi:histidine--tRNA ligase [Candidatus Woesearchaeota archaeon]|nr:histidine--tRNA ligase [Candidatus Woesearchaeota archaeon]